jgi:hypothetical protein
MERVKGIEPSYSAWKAAALPLSYTRATLINYHATRAVSTVLASIQPWKSALEISLANSPAFRRLPGAATPLNMRRLDNYTDVSINNERR